MKVIVNFGGKKVVVPCGADGNISIKELINLATAKYCKLTYNNGLILNSDQFQLRLNNGAIVDPDDRVYDVVDDREELFALFDSQEFVHQSNNNGELSSSITSSNLSSSLSEHERLMTPSSYNRHEVVVTDADLRTRSLRVKNETNSNQSIFQYSSSSNNKMTHKQTHSPPTHDATAIQSSDDIEGMFNIYTDDKTGDKIFSIILPKENSPLGIHVIPFNDNEQQVNGLVLRNIEPDGRIKRQGILQINDRIIEINRTNIEQCSFEKAQFIFRTALLESQLELKIIRKTEKSRSTLNEINQNNETFVDNDFNINSRKLGKIFKITLIKGNDGLGFKLASRDNPIGVANPIYVKTIFPKGAAIDDGRLQRGDRLLTVNSIEVTRMSLQETVGLLRETRIGDTVELCISRQRDGSLPKDLINDGSSTNEILTFHIPLNDTSSAGLGITLKGKTSIIDGQSIDLGIFVKSILTGGAASRDNRLRPNDQIVVINDSSLLNMSNLEAAAILYEAVRHEIHPGHINVTISRSSMTNDEQLKESTKNVRETDLSCPSSIIIPINNDENELDLTTYVPPPILRKPPSQQTNKNERHSSRTNDLNIRSQTSKIRLEDEQDEIDSSSVNRFERETPFRQSVSEKRRLTQQPNKQVIQWKQRSFHESRTNHERKSYPMTNAASIEILTPVIDISDDDDDFNQKDNHCRYSVSRRSEQPMKVLTNNDNNRSSPNLIRSTSFESVQMTNDEHQSANLEERKRQGKLRSRACNDSFRQAVDKSYCQNPNVNDDESNRTEKQRFRFANFFTTKSKRKDNQEEKISKSFVIQPPTSSNDNDFINFYPPPPAQFSSVSKPSKFSYSSISNQQQGYQPYRFETNDCYSSTYNDDYKMKDTSGKSSLSTTNQKNSHPPIPREFFHTNLNGSQSLKSHQTTFHSSILPSTFNVQPSHFTSYSHNIDIPLNISQQQPRRIGYSAAPVYPTSQNYFHFQNPANV